MGNNRIKYLVKFVTEESHANDLLDGKLFMRPSRYFRSLESENLDHSRGDQTEGAIFADARGTAVNYLGIFQNDDLPIFCTYTVYENDIADNRIAISKKVVEEFNCEQGFAVLIDYLGFKQDLEKIKETQGINYCEHTVLYQPPSRDRSKEMFVNGTVENLFYKSPRYQYQREHRVVMGEIIDGFRIIDGKRIPNYFFDGWKMLEAKTYNIQGKIHYNPIKISLASSEQSSDFYMLRLP